MCTDVLYYHPCLTFLVLFVSRQKVHLLSSLSCTLTKLPFRGWGFMKLLPDKFVIAIACAVLMAYIFPQLGAPGSPIPINAIASIGIAFIFFFYGLKLSPDKIRSGLKNWKLHVLIQSATFFLFPLVVLATKPFVSEAQHDLWLATFFFWQHCLPLFRLLL